VPRRGLLLAAVVLLVLGAAAVGAATRPSEDRVALAIHRAERLDTGVVIYEVECATDLDLGYGTDPLGSGLGQITVWGRPAVGRCTGTIGDNDQGADRFVDGATSQVVEIEGLTMAELGQERQDQPGG